MTERRQAYRREPIELDLGGEVILSIGPVSWMRRNDFGNEVMRQHSEILNDAPRIYVDESTETAIPQIEAKFAEKFSDPYLLFEYGLAPITFEVVKTLDLTFDQIVAILLAICDVNSMAQLHPLLDPNSLTPTPLGGILSTLAAGEIDTQKTESGPDSSSPESTEPSSVSSPTPS